DIEADRLRLRRLGDAGEGARNLAVARLPRSLVVREHDGDRGTPADLQRFLDRFLQLRALIAQVGRIDAAEGRHRLGYGNDFVGRGGPGRGIDRKSTRLNSV